MGHSGSRDRASNKIALILGIAVVCLAGIGGAAPAASGPGGTIGTTTPRSAENPAAIDSAAPATAEDSQRLGQQPADEMASASAADERAKARQQQQVSTGAARTKIRAAAVYLLTRDRLLIAAPAGADARRAALADPAKQESIRAEAADIWVPKQVADRVSEVMATLQQQVDAPDMPTFDDAKLVVDSWGEVASNANSATVAFTGHFSDLIAGRGGWEDEPESVWAVLLATAPDGHWQLVSCESRPADPGQR